VYFANSPRCDFHQTFSQRGQQLQQHQEQVNQNEGLVALKNLEDAKYLDKVDSGTANIFKNGEFLGHLGCLSP